MKNIIFIINQLRNSGPVRVLYNICMHLDRTQYNPIIIKLMDDDPTRSITHKFRDMDIEVIEYHLSFWQLECLTANVAKMVVRDASKYEEPILHAHSYHPILLCSHIREYPTIATVHSISGEDFVMSKGKLLGNYMCWRFKRALKMIDCPVTISEYMMRYYQSKGCDNCQQMIYNGMDVDKSEPKIDRIEFLRDYECTCDTKIVLVSAWFSFRKNQALVIRELKKSPRRDFLVVFAGKGELLEKCKDEAENDKRFVFLGYRSDIYELYKISDFYMSASRSEGMPLAVLEAVNYGIPPILSSIPPHKEICRLVYDDETLNFNINEEGSLEMLFNKMMNASIDRKKIEQIGEKELSAKAMTEKYCALYNNYYE